MQRLVGKSERKRLAEEAKKGPSANKLEAASRLSMYGKAPTEEVALEEFELFALDRIRVLKSIDDGKGGCKLTLAWKATCFSTLEPESAYISFNLNFVF